VSKIHRWMIAIDGNARPGNIHGRGIHNRDGADGAGDAQRFPALSSGLVMRSKRSGNIRRRSGEIDDDFSLKVKPGKFIEILFRNLQAVANKNQSRGKRYRSMRGASADEGIVGKRKWLRLAVGDESKRGLGFIDFELVETHRLVEAVRAR